MSQVALPFTVDFALAREVMNFHFAKDAGILLLAADDDQAYAIHQQTLKIEAVNELQRQMTGKALQLFAVDDEAFQQYLTQAFSSSSTEAMAIATRMEDDMDLSQLVDNIPTNTDLLANSDDAPIIRLLNALFIQAIKRPASDIHIESFADKMIVRLRVDGVLHKVLDIQRTLAPLIISRIKVMAKLDIAEKRLPQDGRMMLNLAGHQIDVRVSTLPANYGERIVLRILDKQQARLNLQKLGMRDNSLKAIRHLIAQPHGIILVTGPTGSGKTTSLYAALTELNNDERNILTVEDPIEYDLPGIGQTAVNYKVDMTFARGLRSILRQDPDVVMLGEIRDKETAEIAVQASLTGHLVLSTLHTNTAIGAITRLQDMDVEPFLLASSLIGIAAQRLIRLLCPDCKQVKTPSPAESKLLGHDGEIYQPNGCAKCQFSGYQGRSGIYEIILLNENIRQMIHDGKNEPSLLTAIRKDYPSIQHDGFARVSKGDTSIAEVLRVVGN